MIIQTFSIHNFGIFAGRHQLDLMPKRGQPVTLIGALNGSGKTTILEGIQLCLFGRNAKFLQGFKGGYVAYLTESISRRNLSNSASVSMRFISSRGRKKSVYEVTRTWTIRGKGAQDIVQVSVDSVLDQDLSDRWPEVVERFLPSQLSDLFYFDGERIESLAEPNRCSELIRTGLSALLGLDLIADLERSLAVLGRRIRTAVVSADDKVKLLKIEEALNLLTGQRSRLEDERSKALDKIGTLGLQLSASRTQLEHQGGELYRQRDQLKSKRDQLKDSVMSKQASLVTIAESALPLGLLKEELSELRKVCANSISIEQKNQIEHAIESYVARLVDELHRCGLLQQEQLARVKEVHGRVVRAELGVSQAMEVRCSVDAVRRLEDEIMSLQPDALQQVLQLESLKAELDRADAQLLAVPSEEKISDLLAQLSSLEKELEEAEFERRSLEAHCARVDKDASELVRQHERLSEEAMLQISEEKLHSKMRLQLERGRQNLIQFMDEIRGRNIERIETLICEGLQKLLRKKKLIKSVSICPETFMVTLMIVGEGSVPAVKLSAGERQLLAVSVLWALARASGRKLPTIIDTPLGRLDSNHRQSFVENYFPFAADQVVLLSTDEEVVGHYYETMKPFIANEYLLEYDEESQSSQIHLGYFKKVGVEA